MEKYLAPLSRQCLHLEPSSTGFAEMYGREEAHRLEVRALRDAALKDRVRAEAVSSSAARHAGRPKIRIVAFGHAKEKVAGFLALPRDPGRHRAIIVIHEWWGLNEWVKEQAEKLAANGYVALAVDLYDGKVAADPSEARKLKRGLRQDPVIGDLKAAFDYLAGRPDVDAEHIGSLWWSMGGGLAVQLAMHEPRLAACVVNYGPLPTDIADIQKIDVPVLGMFGALDHGIRPDKVRGFEASMKAAGKRVDIRIYDGAGHGFENPTNQTGYRPAAAADAWLHTLAFLRRSEW